MSNLKYSRDHEWVRLEDNGDVVIGITDFAQQELGDVVYVELPEIGHELKAGEDACVVESVKAASEVKAPINGNVLAVNDKLNDEPELVNSDPTGNGWFMKLKPAEPGELDQLLDESAYNEFIQGLD